MEVVNQRIEMESIALYLAEITSVFKKLEDEHKGNRWDFSRRASCILTFPKIIVLVLSLVSSGKDGTDTHIRIFLKHSRRSGLWSETRTVKRDAVNKARRKIHWSIFSNLLRYVVYLAFDVWPDSPKYTYKGLSVYSVDGSKYTLPSSSELREEFDPDSGLENAGKGHFPQCLVSTAYDVFRRIPVARTITPYGTSERKEAEKMIPCIPNGIIVYDRGYPSYEIFLFHNKNYSGYYIFRCATSNTFPAVEKFMSSRRVDQIIHISPSNSYKEKVSAQERRNLRPIRIRALKVKNDAGETVLLLTNLFDRKTYLRSEIGELYRARWEVESYYRDEKVTCEIEAFRSKNGNGIRQELLAATVMSVIARTLMVLSGDIYPYQSSVLDDGVKSEHSIEESESCSKSTSEDFSARSRQKKVNSGASVQTRNKKPVSRGSRSCSG